jgi:hypothetical protein
MEMGQNKKQDDEGAMNFRREQRGRCQIRQTGIEIGSCLLWSRNTGEGGEMETVG